MEVSDSLEGQQRNPPSDPSTRSVRTIGRNSNGNRDGVHSRFFDSGEPVESL